MALLVQAPILVGVQTEFCESRACLWLWLRELGEWVYTLNPKT